jgi:hypothetical protein
MDIVRESNVFNESGNFFFLPLGDQFIIEGEIVGLHLLSNNNLNSF